MDRTGALPAACDRAIQSLTLIVAYLLKSFYSTASVEDLRWILEPTAAVVSLFSGYAFEEEAHTGFFSRELFFLIAPACAGVNFLIVAFCTAVFGFVRSFRGVRAKLAVFFVGAIVAYSLTVTANAVRILIAIWLHRRPAFLMAEQLHRIEGVAVYFFSLCALFLAVRALLNRRTHAARSSG